MESVNVINKDVSDVRLLPTTVLTYPLDLVCFSHLLKTQQCCLCPNGRYNTLLATYMPSYPSHPFLSFHPLLYAINDIRVAVKKLLKIQ